LRRIRRLVVRDFSETMEESYEEDGKPPQKVACKYLRYVSILNQRGDMSPNEKAAKIKRIRKDIHIWLSLNNKNIMPLIGYQWGIEPCLVFHWYQNGNITAYSRNKPIALRAKLLEQAANGLAYLHGHDPAVIHAAINPSNVIVNDNGDAMLCDFGLLPDMQVAEFGMTTSDREISSTAGYVSPELLETGQWTKASDIYAFGSLILEVLSDRPPFPDQHFIKTLNSILAGETSSKASHPGLPAAFWPAIQRCWEVNVSKRPSADELSSLIAEAQVLHAQSSYLLLGGVFGAVCSLFAGLFWFR